MTQQVQLILDELKALSSEKAARIYQKVVVSESVLGVNKGPLRKLAQTYLPNHELGLALWETKVYEARIMATMIIEPKKLTIEDLDRLISESNSVFVIDELCFDVFESFAANIELFQRWVKHPDLMHQRVAYNAAIVEVHRKRVTLVQAEALLDRIEAELCDSEELVKYAMNRCMVEIAINYPDLTQRVLTKSEQMGVYKEMKVAKGCTSPYAPDWIHAILRRKT